MVKIAGTVNDTVNLDRASPHPVEYKVGFQDEDAILRAAEGSISRNAAKLRVMPKAANSAIELFDESGRPSWTVLRDEIQDTQQVFLGRR
jgi:hypothetical protein